MRIRVPQKGFSLIKLLAVVTVMLIIAAIAIPNLLRSRISANEASTVAAIRALSVCALTYAYSNQDIGFPNSIADMGPDGEGCVDQTLVEAASGAAPRSGYTLTYARTNVFWTVAFGFNITAVPAGCNRTGVRSFFADQSNVIRFTSDATSCPPATAASAPLG